MILTAKSVLLFLPSALEPQVVGVSITDAERLICDGVNDALAQLQEDPGGAEVAGAGGGDARLSAPAWRTRVRGFPRWVDRTRPGESPGLELVRERLRRVPKAGRG